MIILQIYYFIESTYMNRNELPPSLPHGMPSVNPEDNPYRLKKSQIGAYKTTNTTPFQAPLPYTSPGTHDISYSAPAHDVLQEQTTAQTGRVGFSRINSLKLLCY